MSEFDDLFTLPTEEKTIKKTRLKQSSIDESKPKIKKKKILSLDKMSDLVENTDIEILSILAKKYKAHGTNVVRHNQKNPFVQDLARLSYLVQNIETFKLMHNKGLIGKTQYSGQWQIL